MTLPHRKCCCDLSGYQDEGSIPIQGRRVETYGDALVVIILVIPSGTDVDPEGRIVGFWPRIRTRNVVWFAAFVGHHKYLILELIGKERMSPSLHSTRDQKCVN